MIEIIQSAALTSVQDLGRGGLRHQGICQSGALDYVSSRQANILVGNPVESAVLEVALSPLEIRFLDDRIIAVCGSDFNAMVTTNATPSENKRVLPGFALAVHAGETLRLNGTVNGGGRAYVAISGGINTPIVLGSRSTDLNAGFGGVEGRSLQRGDTIPLGSHTAAHSCLLPTAQNPITSRGLRALTPQPQIRALEGVDSALLGTKILDNFWQQNWRIDARSNRMGIRLQGRACKVDHAPSLLSSGVLPGDVQLPGDGQPIVLANDAQTTGGYPRVAHIIQADLWQLAHLVPNSHINFTCVTLEEALQANEKMNTYWQRVNDWRDSI